jgi:hypothetical protein
VLAQQGTTSIIRRNVDDLLIGDRLLLREAGDAFIYPVSRDAMEDYL